MASGDKSAQYKYARINVSYNLATLAKITTDPVAGKYEERQIVLLDEIFMTTPYAFWLIDLPNVTIVVEYLLSKVEKNADFKEYLMNFLELFSVPPMLCRTDEILEGMKKLQEYFSFFGYILATAEDKSYKQQIIKALWKILLRKQQVLNRCISLKICHEAIEGSRLPEVIASLMDITEDEEFYSELLGVSVEMAKISTTICITMLKEGALRTILTKADPNHKSYITIFTPFHDLPKENQNLDTILELTELLLRTLDNVPKKDRTRLYPLGIKTLWSVRYTLRVSVLSGTKIRRNFLMSLILKIMHLYHDEPLSQSGIVSDITTLVVAMEFGTGGTWAASVHFNEEKEDFEFKKMLLVCVYYFTKLFAGEYGVRDKSIILGMLKFITPGFKSKWGLDQLRVLKYYSLTVLERMIPDFIDEFFKFKGVLRWVNHILQLCHLDILMKTSEDRNVYMDGMDQFVQFCDEKVENYGLVVFRFLYFLKDSRLKTAMLIDFYKICPYDPSILIAALRLLYVTLTARRDAEMMLYCVSINLCRNLQNMMFYILKFEHLNTYNQEAMHYGLDILTILGDSMEVSLFDNVVLVLAIFNRVLKPTKLDIAYELKMMISAVNCFWTLGSTNDDFFISFCEYNGVFILLDVLKYAKFPLQIVGLGLLTDLCEESSAFPYLISWRNKGMTFLQLLMKIFREENKLIGVKTPEDGPDSEYVYSLMGKTQRLQYTQLTDPNSSPSITDMDGSCRPKIYALVKLIEVRFEKQFSVSNEYYKIYDYNLTLEDRLTKVLCENYLSLKMAETWLELNTLYKYNNFEPVDSDQIFLEQMLKTGTQWAINMHKLQIEIKEKQRLKDVISEAEFYEMLRESKLGNALEAMKEIHFIARTTENIFYLTKKMKDNMACSDLGLTTHRTMNTTIGLNWIKNQKITVISDKNDTDVDLVQLVSPITESVTISNVSSNADSTVSFGIENDCEEENTKPN